MCPVCISTAAIIAYGSGATAGATALVVGTRRAWQRVFVSHREPRSGEAAPPPAEPAARADEAR